MAGRRLLPLTLVYAAFALATLPLSIIYDVGATPEGDASDALLTGTGFTPPLFLPILLIGGALLARRSALLGAALVALLSLAILGGSTLNVANDVVAVLAALAPTWLAYVLAAVSAVLALGMLLDALAALIAQIHHRPVSVESKGGR